MTPQDQAGLRASRRMGEHHRRHASRRSALLAALAAGWLVAACQAQAGADGRGAPQAKLMARIEAEIGDAACTQDAQCRTLPVGEKACGGPERWLAWSTQRTQASRLQPLANELATLARQRNERSGMLSNCQYNADPGVRCRGGRCSLRDRSAAH